MSGRGGSNRGEGKGGGGGRQPYSGIGRGGGGKQQAGSGGPQRIVPSASQGRGGGIGGGGGRVSQGRGGGRGGNFGRGGGGGSSTSSNVSNPIDEVLTNILPASISPAFEFYLYSVDFKDKNDAIIEQRGRRHDLFRQGFMDLYLKDTMGLDETYRKELLRVVFFEGSFFFSARVIPGLDDISKLPVVLLNGTTTNGDTMSIVDMVHYVTPTELKSTMSPSIESITRNVNELSIDPTRCGDCTRTFSSKEACLQHCRETGHTPKYIESIVSSVNAIPATGT